MDQLRETLAKKGFKQTHEDDIVCRFRYQELLVDVMSTKSIAWASSNRWFKPGFEMAIEYDLEEIKIKILPLAYFLASKMDAFFDRGRKDLYGSHDFEDILYVLNYSTDLVPQILKEDEEVVHFLKECAENILNDHKILAAIPGHLYYETADERYEIIKGKLESLANAIT